jgi:transmembrane 9 superfamily protein 3
VYAVKNNYWYQMYMDDLPIWGVLSDCMRTHTRTGMVGEMEAGGDAPVYKIFTHKKFELGENNGQIVDVNLTSDGRTTLAPGAKLDFSYEVPHKC